MPVSRISLDLSAPCATDEAGARSLAAICRVLRLEGLQVDVDGIQGGVHSVHVRLGLSLGNGRDVTRSLPAAAAGERPRAAVPIPQTQAGDRRATDEG
ncbi:MAG TPA: hypothetical protein VHJ18_13780 [Streptosporangiaceae bacterium]|jgi:hypothetical protein|nr:hypothetical protein [Streptosporangiaceae bacterium]